MERYVEIGEVNLNITYLLRLSFLWMNYCRLEVLESFL